MILPKHVLLRVYNFWPPFAGAGIRIGHIAPDFRSIDVELKLRWWNKNIVGSHYGGSLASMTDPFYMVMLIENLGRNYVVWDRAATIQFLKPGFGKVRAEFRLTQAQIDAIKKEADQNGKTESTLGIVIKDDKGKVIAEVDKVLYVRRRDNGSQGTAKIKKE